MTRLRILQRLLDAWDDRRARRRLDADGALQRAIRRHPAGKARP